MPIFLLLLFVFCALRSNAQNVEIKETGKAPVIVIPGITGSSLYNKKTNEEAWFRVSRPKGDDIRLPMSANLERNRDLLEPRDILRGVKIVNFLPEIEIYENLIFALETRGGYREAEWDEPGKDGYQDAFYVFPYDWRRDNVETARLLIKKIEALKVKLKKPNLKFNIIAHSMGGLISRYAAMYGDADIPAGEPKPTWTGARHFDKIFLIGTPNEGSVLSLRALLSGYSVTGLSLPFVQNFNRFDVFTIPAMFQLLPLMESLIAYDENLKRMPLDIYNPVTWDEYDWSVWKDPNFKNRFNADEQKNARAYFRAALERGRRFQLALHGTGRGPVPVSYYLIGGDCKDTPDAMLILRNERKDRWETFFKPRSFMRSDGTRVTEAEVKALLNAKGDGTVTKRSLTSESIPADLKALYLPIVADLFQCEDHTKLVSNAAIQDKLLLLINPAAAN